jgi:hypothetical protein
MKQLKQLFAVTLLVLTLGIHAYAGDMGMPGKVPPPPPPPAAAPCEMDTPDFAAVAPGDIDTPSLAKMAIETLFGALWLF